MPPQLIACPDCDLLYRAPASTDHGSARCQRCGAGVYGRKRNSIERTLALTIAGVILFIIANLLLRNGPFFHTTRLARDRAMGVPQ